MPVTTRIRNKMLWTDEQIHVVFLPATKGPTKQYKLLHPTAAFNILSAVKLPWICLFWMQEKSSKSGIYLELPTLFI